MVQRKVLSTFSFVSSTGVVLKVSAGGTFVLVHRGFALDAHNVRGNLLVVLFDLDKGVCVPVQTKDRHLERLVVTLHNLTNHFGCRHITVKRDKRPPKSKRMCESRVWYAKILLELKKKPSLAQHYLLEGCQRVDKTLIDIALKFGADLKLPDKSGTLPIEVLQRCERAKAVKKKR